VQKGSSKWVRQPEATRDGGRRPSAAPSPESAWWRRLNRRSSLAFLEIVLNTRNPDHGQLRSRQEALIVTHTRQIWSGLFGEFDVDRRAIDTARKLTFATLLGMSIQSKMGPRKPRRDGRPERRRSRPTGLPRRCALRARPRPTVTGGSGRGRASLCVARVTDWTREGKVGRCKRQERLVAEFVALSLGIDPTRKLEAGFHVRCPRHVS